MCLYTYIIDINEIKYVSLGTLWSQLVLRYDMYHSELKIFNLFTVVSNCSENMNVSTILFIGYFKLFLLIIQNRRGPFCDNRVHDPPQTVLLSKKKLIETPKLHYSASLEAPKLQKGNPSSRPRSHRTDRAS